MTTTTTTEAKPHRMYVPTEGCKWAVFHAHFSFLYRDYHYQEDCTRSAEIAARWQEAHLRYLDAGVPWSEFAKSLFPLDHRLLPDPEHLCAPWQFAVEWDEKSRQRTKAYDTLEEAQAAADYLMNRGFGELVAIVLPYFNAAWVWREEAREAFIPWDEEPWWIGNRKIHNLHYVHRAAGDPSKLAYTETWEKGARDRQNVIKPGRYLKKYFGDFLTDDDIEHWTQEWAKGDTVDLHFTETPDDVERVYTEGPRSCMSYNTHSYATQGIHPSRVYSTDECAVAYVERNDKITARVVVNTERKLWGCVYGDRARLTSALRALGYEEGDLSGTKIARIETPDGDVVMPYIDGELSVEDCGDHFRIGGNLAADNTNGLLDFGVPCDHCGDRADEEDMHYVSGHGHVCEGCYSEYYFCCEVTGDNYHLDDAVTLACGSMISDGVFERYGFYCEVTGENYLHTKPSMYSSIRTVEAIETACGSLVSYHAVEAGAVMRCEHDDGYYMAADMVEIELTGGRSAWVAEVNADYYRSDNADDLLEPAFDLEAA